MEADELIQPIIVNPAELEQMIHGVPDGLRGIAALDLGAPVLEWIRDAQARGDIIEGDPEVVLGVLGLVKFLPTHQDDIDPVLYPKLLSMMTHVVADGLTSAANAGKVGRPTARTSRRQAPAVRVPARAREGELARRPRLPQRRRCRSKTARGRATGATQRKVRATMKSSTLRMAWRGLWRHPRRTILMVSMVAFASLVIIVMWGVMDGFMASMVDSQIAVDQGSVKIHAAGYEEDPAPEHGLTPEALVRRGEPRLPPPGVTDERAAALRLRHGEVGLRRDGHRDPRHRPRARAEGHDPAVPDRRGPRARGTRARSS